MDLIDSISLNITLTLTALNTRSN